MSDLLKYEVDAILGQCRVWKYNPLTCTVHYSKPRADGKCRVWHERYDQIKEERDTMP